MKDNPFYHQDDPTEPLRPSSPSQQEQQGKLVLGGFQEPQKRVERQPYQYTPRQYEDATIYPQQQPGRPGQQVPPGRMSAPPVNPNVQQYPDRPGQQVPPGGMPANPNVQQYPYRQGGQMPGPGAPIPPPKLRRPRRRRGCLITTLVVLLLICILGVFTITTGQRVLAFGSAISTQTPLSSQTGYMGGDRVNLLVMGYGGSGHDGAYLTDSMTVMSLLPQSHHTTLVSIPRDLFVQIPPNSGRYDKINSAYSYGSNGGTNPVGGGNMAAEKVSTVTGLDVKYWVTINFTGFRDFINAIGGVDVYVPDSFNACYPKNDDANVDPNWIKVQFNKGMQNMDGARAIQYARAREPLEVCGKGKSQNPAELTDFARSARQQIIIKAAMSKLRQISTWPSLYKALDALQHTVYTNLSLADLAEFALKMDLNNAHHVGLSNQNVLQDVYLSNGTYTLQAANGNWQAIKDYVKQQLYN